MTARDLRESTLVLIAICGGGCMTTIEGAHLTQEIAAIRFPKSSSAAEARQEIKSIKKFPKAACTG